MTFEECDQVDAERTDAIRGTVSSLRAARYPTLRSPPTVKIIDRVKTYIREKKGRDPRSTGDPLGGAADPAPVQRDRSRQTQNRDDEGLAVSTAHEAPEPESATEPTTESASEPTTEPVIQPATGSATEPATEPTTESTSEPTTEPVTGSAAESATEPTTESTSEPTTEPVIQPATEPAAEPAAAPAACPRCGATGEAPCTTPSGKATKTHKGREQ